MGVRRGGRGWFLCHLDQGECVSHPRRCDFLTTICVCLLLPPPSPYCHHTAAIIPTGWSSPSRSPSPHPYPPPTHSPHRSGHPLGVLPPQGGPRRRQRQRHHGQRAGLEQGARSRGQDVCLLLRDQLDGRVRLCQGKFEVRWRRKAAACWDARWPVVQQVLLTQLRTTLAS